MRDARATELRREVLNSERLRARFAQNPHDLEVLRHDRGLVPASRSPHLSHVPKYLLPAALVAAGATADGGARLGRRKKQRRGGAKRAAGAGADARRRTDNDPLHSFSLDGCAVPATTGGGASGRAGAAPGGDGDLFGGADDDDDGDDDGGAGAARDRATAAGPSSPRAPPAPRPERIPSRKWKERHGKGEFSNKRRAEASSGRGASAPT